MISRSHIWSWTLKYGSDLKIIWHKYGNHGKMWNCSIFTRAPTCEYHMSIIWNEYGITNECLQFHIISNSIPYYSQFVLCARSWGFRTQIRVPKVRSFQIPDHIIFVLCENLDFQPIHADNHYKSRSSSGAVQYVLASQKKEILSQLVHRPCWDMLMNFEHHSMDKARRPGIYKNRRTIW